MMISACISHINMMDMSNPKSRLNIFFIFVGITADSESDMHK